MVGTPFSISPSCGGFLSGVPGGGCRNEAATTFLHTWRLHTLNLVLGVTGASFRSTGAQPLGTGSEDPIDEMLSRIGGSHWQLLAAEFAGGPKPPGAVTASVGGVSTKDDRLPPYMRRTLARRPAAPAVANPNSRAHRLVRCRATSHRRSGCYTLVHKPKPPFEIQAHDPK